MPKYRTDFMRTIRVTVITEAETEDEAFDIAFDKLVATVDLQCPEVLPPGVTIQSENADDNDYDETELIG